MKTEPIGADMAALGVAARTLCVACPHAATLLAVDAGYPHDVRIRGIGGPRIDHFPRAHSELAAGYLADREVRIAVAARLPAFALARLIADPEPEVRRIVAARALPQDALLLLEDEDWLVRLAAVRRAPLETIRCRLDDPEPDVRRAVRERLAAGQGGELSTTENADEPMG